MLSFFLRISLLTLLGISCVGCNVRDYAEGNNQPQSAKYTEDDLSPNQEQYHLCIIDHIQGSVTPTKWTSAARECSDEFPTDPMPDILTILFREGQEHRVTGALSWKGNRATLKIYNGDRSYGISHIEIALEQSGEVLLPRRRTYRIEVEIPPLSAASTDFFLLWENELDFEWSIENVWGFPDYAAIALEGDIEEREELERKWDRIEEEALK